MKKLKIIEVNNYDYTLKDKDGNLYELNIEFQGLKEMPQVNDIIYISEKLLDKKYKEYSNTYTFGNIDDKSGRDISTENEIDLIVIEMNNQKYYLKRLYG